MNASQIASAIESGGFDPGDLRVIRRAVERAERTAEARELSRIASDPAIEVVKRYAGDWGCYEHKDTGRAVAAMNASGVALVEAVRAGIAADVKKAIRAIRGKQERWSRTGSADTEGREALWSLLRNACRGSELDANAIWDSSY